MTDGTKTSNKTPFHLTGIWESGFVKMTLEIDDELYCQAKAHASLTGRKMKDLVTEGLRLALQPAARITGPEAATAACEIEACFAEADQLMNLERKIETTKVTKVHENQ